MHQVSALCQLCYALDQLVYHVGPRVDHVKLVLEKLLYQHLYHVDHVDHVNMNIYNYSSNDSKPAYQVSTLGS
ncbi:hypothetical protein [Lactiplantibacillus plantarum]|uniref:hypothetical protein n=1 Tax=Lactiplantibacillus plantarum TaxID=1590 RepID=UPI000B3D210E|nr:hypothetical protein [Lactiplantibacillus plantarum]